MGKSSAVIAMIGKVELYVLAIAIVWAIPGLKAQSNEVVVSVRSCLERYLNDIPERRRSENGIADYGRELRSMPHYADFAACVSNRLSEVMGCFGACATNRFERHLLLTAGWAYDDDYYLRFYDEVATLAVSNVISYADLRTFNCGHLDERRMNLLPLRYNESLVSNIVDKLEIAGGDTNRCERIRSGAARLSYLSIMEELNSPVQP